MKARPRFVELFRYVLLLVVLLQAGAASGGVPRVVVAEMFSSAIT